MTRSPHKILEDRLARNKRVFAMWMACHTQEIAAAKGCSAQPIKDVISDFPANSSQSFSRADHSAGDPLSSRAASFGLFVDRIG